MSELQSKWENEQQRIFTNWIKVTLFYMAVPLVLLFSIVDYYYHKEYLLDFFYARLSIVPVAAVAYNLYRLKFINDKGYLIPGYIFTIFIGLLNTYMAYKTGQEMSSYYAGLNLVGVGAAFLPWRLRNMLVACFFIYAPYFILCLLKWQDLDMSYFIPHAAFIISTVFLAVIININIGKLRFSELESRLKLNLQIEKQENVIRIKTQEGIYLERLTKQFSPQVVEAIKKNEISIEKSVRREITCIFIDIENSTDRSAKLDYTEYTEVLSDFFTGCVDIFLKHNVTVGTYLGDGILAFVNAPGNVPDHTKIAIQACIDLLRMLHSKKAYYKRRWRNNFNIRIGINSGFASIGFFPSFARGTYTAIGGSINLAARFCSVAMTDSICIPKNLIIHAAGKLEGISVDFHKRTTALKGFENEEFELYSITPKYVETAIGFDKCPVCVSELIEYAEHGNSTFLKCTKCNYVDVVDSISKKDKIFLKFQLISKIAS